MAWNHHPLVTSHRQDAIGLLGRLHDWRGRVACIPPSAVKGLAKIHLNHTIHLTTSKKDQKVKYFSKCSKEVPVWHTSVCSFIFHICPRHISTLKASHHCGPSFLGTTNGKGLPLGAPRGEVPNLVSNEFLVGQRPSETCGASNGKAEQEDRNI